MKRNLLVLLFLFGSIFSFVNVHSQSAESKHYKFVHVENFMTAKSVIFRISDDGQKFEETKVDRSTSSSGYDYNEVIKLMQRFQGEGWKLVHTQYMTDYKLYLIFER